MNWNEAIFQVIEFRSFSNFWYWLTIASVWSMVCHWVMGVPIDMIFRARRHGGQAADDLRQLVIITLNRFASFINMTGTIFFGLVCFVLSALFMSGFIYGFELPQSMFFIAFPLTIAGIMNLRLVQRLRQELPPTDQLIKALLRHRFWLQVLSVIAILCTSMFGMYQNLAVTVYF